MIPRLLIASFFSLSACLSFAQTDSLFKKVQQLDNLLFSAYNRQDMPVFKNYFTKDLEWYQDNGGLLNYEQIVTAFREIFNKENKLTRTLVPGSLEVFPIKGYGAVETGKHRFSHIESGKKVVGIFKFVMLWKQEGEDWRISRVISYDHAK